ncbi:MAG: DUF2478 domain-containing protein [Rhodobacteraceae bacterium]|nr:DUF2478 domain-containing protein [Paracoccaceae bacterium]
MLGFVSAPEQGAGDRLLAAVGARLLAQGVAVAGVVQINTETDPSRPCQMDLRLLPSGATVRISQDLGPAARGCRLDPSGLETAVAQVEAMLDSAAPRLLILNKFGKHEIDGRGFRPLIGKAMILGVPVLTSVSARNRTGFAAFAEGIAEQIAPCETDILRWCHGVMGL